MKLYFKIYFLCYLLLGILLGCKNKHIVDDKFHFVQMDAATTNISFSNNITENDSINVFTNEYMYNGSGVGIGDFNNDGLQDIFFAGSMVSSKLFINKGNFNFDDITAKAGIKTDSWCTGVSIVDINSDGFDDIYVCVSHNADAAKRRNLLFINDGKLNFTEQAADYGLADDGYATQAAFLDFDKDGDLDMYLLNHRLFSHTANNIQPKDTTGNSPAADKLFRNEGIPEGGKNPVFHDVSKEAGIKEDGYGLGIVITDVNGDNWPDIYVANDYIANDLLWLNNKNGSFTNVIATAIKHQSYNSMGVDAADINNDGLSDVAVVDMLPETNERKKMMFSATSQEKYDMQQRFGYEPSYMRNMLHLNNGNRTINNTLQPFYSEIGQLAGTFETDWSWSVLIADYDNDGFKDMHITNGLGKDMTNNDYASFRNSEASTGNYMFGSDRTDKKLDQHTISSLRKTIDQFGSVKMDNYFLHNNGNLTFSNTTQQTGLSVPSISSGAAYADLDNDGDLDLIVNNINQPAFVWKNELRKSAKDSQQTYLSIKLNGLTGNTAAIGAQITLWSNNKMQYAEQSPVRGFESSVDQRIHFGLGAITNIDSLKVKWPDDKIQVVRNIKTNQVLELRQKDAYPESQSSPTIATTIFSNVGDQLNNFFKHKEFQNFDFGFHQPLFQKYSQLGPCIATGDVNGDGLEDYFVGGAANQSGQIFIQNIEGKFTSTKLVEDYKQEEDLGAVFFDADGDKDLDLLITGGSFEFTVGKYNQPRLYNNDGKGKFSLLAIALPIINDITDAITIGDYDQDGDIDVFIAGRLLPQKYPQTPRSYLLQNNGGIFTDVTNSVCAALASAGMITSAIFTDFNNDKKQDLIICGEWTNIRFFKNQNNKLIEVTDATQLTEMHGMWRSLQQADIDRDGDMDYIAGNIGLNNSYHIVASKPMFLYAKDIDRNGFTDLIPAYSIKNNKGAYAVYPGLDRNQLSEQVPSVKKKYLLHADYAKITMEQLKNDFGKEDWLELKCKTIQSIWIENLSNGKFKSHALPIEAQFAPINSIVASDFTNDGFVDLVVAGNEYQASLNTGRYDASYGLVLKGDGKGNFTTINPITSGLIIDGDVKDMQLITLRNKRKALLIALNDASLQTYLLQPSKN
ncbi:MAG: hypothetical protein RLY16_1098 [Bacteroidota bacterium]